MTFREWADAVAVATGYAQQTGVRWRVRRTLAGRWSVGRVDGVCGARRLPPRGELRTLIENVSGVRIEA